MKLPKSEYRKVDLKHLKFRHSLLFLCGYYHDEYDPFTFADKVINELDKNYISKEEIEKRIDLEIKDIEKHINEIGIYSIDSQYHQGYKDGLRKVKETLK